MGEYLLKSSDEYVRLEEFFRRNDPTRCFAELRRVSDGRPKSPAFWTLETNVLRIQAFLLRGLVLRLFKDKDGYLTNPGS